MQTLTQLGRPAAIVYHFMLGVIDFLKWQKGGKQLNVMKHNRL